MDLSLIIISVVVLLIIYIIIIFNSLITLKNRVENGWAQIETQLQRRYDLIPNLIETVKGYARHESELFEKITAARANTLNAGSVNEKIQADNAITSTLKSLFAVAEAYPDLKANTNFMDLQRQLQAIETDIAQSRKYYNGVVKEMNNKVEMFPSNIFAGIFGFVKYPFFTVADETERENVKVSFS